MIQPDTPVEQVIADFLAPIAQTSRLWVAYSGGIDSHVLLHALSSVNVDWPVSAVHIHHGLHQQADQWAKHCQSICQQLSVPIVIKEVNAQAKKGESREAVARQARYQSMRSLLAPGDYLLLAHHQQDQAETFLLQLLRGAGLKGLSAMSPFRPFGEAYLARPFLSLAKQSIIEYAQKQSLQWVEDSSNDDLSFDRNFVRHRVMPLLAQCRAGVDKTLARSARHCAEAERLIATLAAIDLKAVQQDDSSLSVMQLKTLSGIRQANLLRYWLQQQSLPLPSEVKLKHILQDAVYSRLQAKPCVKWAGVRLRREKDRLWIEVNHVAP